MCSPCVGAGIDFSENYFDLAIHLYADSSK